MSVPNEAVTALADILSPPNPNQTKLLNLIRNNKQLFSPLIPLEENLSVHRETSFQRLKLICQNGVIQVDDFETNPLNIYQVHETVAMLDPSTATKMTAQFNLFAGTIWRLGSDKHRILLNGINNLEDVGCFALTELGYGNNAIQMETTAVYDNATDQFIINTSTDLGQKFWITNGALHAHWSVVWAQLIISGEPKGVHAFLVPIRDKATMAPMRGIRIQDMGHKIGCNGVDNALIEMKDVTIGRDFMLDTISQVHVDGSFSSVTTSKKQRFLLHAEQLLSGRVCIANMMLGVAKMSLYLILKYSSLRLSVGPSGRSDVPIELYTIQRRSLGSLFTKTLAYAAWVQEMNQTYSQFLLDTCKKSKDTAAIGNSTFTSIALLACAIKPCLSWNAERVASIARERAGGAGYLTNNMFGEMIAFAHAGITAEGDNRVLWNKVAIELIKGHGQGLITPVNTEFAVPASFEKEAWSSQFVVETIHRLLHQRVEHLVTVVQECIGPKGFYSSWMLGERCSRNAKRLATAFCDLQAFDALRSVVRRIRQRNTELSRSAFPLATVLDSHLTLFGLIAIAGDKEYFIGQGHLLPDTATLVFEELPNKELLATTTPINRLTEMLEVFKIPFDLVEAPMVRGEIPGEPGRPVFEKKKSSTRQHQAVA